MTSLEEAAAAFQAELLLCKRRRRENMTAQQVRDELRRRLGKSPVVSQRLNDVLADGPAKRALVQCLRELTPKMRAR